MFFRLKSGMPYFREKSATVTFSDVRSKSGLSGTDISVPPESVLPEETGFVWQAVMPAQTASTAAQAMMHVVFFIVFRPALSYGLISWY